jgi:hypothetical protein
MHMSKNYVLNTACRSKVLVIVTMQNFEVIPNKLIIMYYQMFNHLAVTLHSWRWCLASPILRSHARAEFTLNTSPGSRNLMVSKEQNNSTHRLHLHYKLGCEGLATTLETEIQTWYKGTWYTQLKTCLKQCFYSQWNEDPTRCYLMLFITHDLLNMIQAPLCPSSRAHYYIPLFTTWNVCFLSLDGGKVWVGWLCGWAGGCSSRQPSHTATAVATSPAT